MLYAWTPFAQPTPASTGSLPVPEQDSAVKARSSGAGMLDSDVVDCASLVNRWSLADISPRTAPLTAYTNVAETRNTPISGKSQRAPVRHIRTKPHE